MNFWKRLRWIASIALAVVLCIAFVLAIVHRQSDEGGESDDPSSAQRVIPSVPVPIKGQSTRNSTGL